MTSLRQQTLFTTGASRGVGLAIALRAARDGANIVIAVKTAEDPAAPLALDFFLDDEGPCVRNSVQQGSASPH